MEIKNPEVFGYAIGALAAKLNQLQVIHLGSPTAIAGSSDRTKIILDQMEPYLGFLAEQCGWLNTSDTESSDGASA
jgi:hypothetical protein